MKTNIGKRDIYALSGIILLSAAIMIACVIRGRVYGSELDWVSQHYPIPEYFRTLFYDTHQLFPSYAANIGAGESIYSLSYYGLYSPVIMLSYLFPFVPMGYYIMITSALSVFVSESIFYFFIRKSYCIRVTAFTTALFAFSMPLIYQSHRHIMFVSFIPFLLLSMHFTDKYFETGRRFPLVLCAFLMIMCNYFFAVSALIALAAYGLARVIDERKPFKELIKRYFPFVMLLFVSVLMACVLILPTAYELLSGRDEGNVALSLKSFLPNMRLDWLTYYSYSMGLTGFGVYAMIYSIFHAKGSRRFIAVLTIAFAVFPLLVFILNGTLYFDAKVLFSFLPMALTVVAWLIDDILQNGAHKMLLPLPVFIIGSFVSIFVSGPVISMLMYLLDAAVTAAIILVLRRKHNVYICSLFLVIAFIGCCAKNSHDRLVSTADFEQMNAQTIYELTSQAAQKGVSRTAVNIRRVDTPNKVYGIDHYSSTIYSSIHSKDYNSFYFEQIYNENEYRNSALTTCSQNLLFNSFIGNRFFISDKPLATYGLELVKKTNDGLFLYENENALPLIYNTDKLMSRREYDTLEYPANVEALLRYTITEQDIPNSGFEPGFQRVDTGDIFDIGSILNDQDICELTAEGARHFVLADRAFSFSVKLPESCEGKIKLVRFYVDNSKTEHKRGEDRGGDVSVIINGIKNKLTNPDWKYFNNNNFFEYVLSDMNDTLDIELKGSDFEISDLKIYTISPEELESMNDDVIPFEFDEEATGGDVIKGTINASYDTYLATSFVYHEGFKVTIDGKEVPAEKIDTAFLGVPIEKGTHEVIITFTAPWLTAGKAAGAFGLACFALVIILDLRDKRK